MILAVKTTPSLRVNLNCILVMLDSSLTPSPKDLELFLKLASCIRMRRACSKWKMTCGCILTVWMMHEAYKIVDVFHSLVDRLSVLSDEFEQLERVAGVDEFGEFVHAGSWDLHQVLQQHLDLLQHRLVEPHVPQLYSGKVENYFRHQPELDSCDLVKMGFHGLVEQKLVKLQVLVAEVMVAREYRSFKFPSKFAMSLFIVSAKYNFGPFVDQQRDRVHGCEHYRRVLLDDGLVPFVTQPVYFGVVSSEWIHSSC